MVKATGKYYNEKAALKILLFSSMREQGEGYHISTSHSVANTDAKRQEQIKSYAMIDQKNIQLFKYSITASFIRKGPPFRRVVF